MFEGYGFFLLALLYLLGFPLFLGIALTQWSALKKRLAAMDERIRAMELRERLAAIPGPQRDPDPAPPKLKEEPPEQAFAAQPADRPESVSPPTPSAPPTEQALPARETSAPKTKQNLEQKIASRWGVWLGGIVIAIAGVLLVRYAIDEGLLNPFVRIILGMTLAVVLVGAGEWLRQRDDAPALLADAPDYVPGALAAAGIFAGFATIFAAFSLYDMLSPYVAFGLLAVIALGGLGLALLHGPFLALLGIVAANAIPVLVSTGSNNAWTLFPYLFVIAAAGTELIRHRPWRGVAWTGLVASTIWPLLWALGSWRDGHEIPVTLYALGLAALYLFRLFPGLSANVELRLPARWFRIDQYSGALSFALAAGVLIALDVVLAVRLSHYATIPMAGVAILAALYGLAARRDFRLDLLPVVAAALAVLLIFLWHTPTVVAPYPWGLATGGDMDALAYLPIIPPELQPYTLWAGIYGMLFMAGGFAALWGAQRPGFWASLSVAMPLTLLALAYWRVEAFSPNLSWGLVAIVVGMVMIFLAERLQRYRSGDDMRAGLGAYAVGATAAVALAFTMYLENAWLTVALAIEVAAIAIVYDKLLVNGLRGAATVLAGIVLVRLALNPFVLDYANEMFPVLNWLIWGYAIPAIAFFAARKLFLKHSDDRLIALLEAGALVFATLFVTFQIRSLMSPDFRITDTYGFAEQGVQTLAWMGISYALLRLEARDPRPVYRWGRRILLGLAAFNVLIFEGLTGPLFSHDVIGDWPIFNLLLVGYGIPGAFAIVLHLQAKKIGAASSASLYAIGSLGLLFVWMNAEIRHWFHGPVITMGSVSSGESWTYTAGWLLFAGVLLAIGILRSNAAARYASLAFIGLTVIKTFLYDLSEFEGIGRAASFLALGLGLVLVGYLYQRYVFPKSVDDVDADNKEVSK